MSHQILQIPQQHRDKFKALKVIYDQEKELEYEEELMYRELERKYENLFNQVYDEREAVLSGGYHPTEKDLDGYNMRQLELDDYKPQKLQLFENNLSLNKLKKIEGVPGFWLQAMQNHPNISKLITKRDYIALENLIDIRSKLHQDGFGFDLIFVFQENKYFSNSILEKSYIAKQQNVIDCCKGCDIYWTATEYDLTKTKVIRKHSKTPILTKTDSFFNFFKNLLPISQGQAKSITVDQEEEIAEKMEQNYELGKNFKDQLIPLAVEYYFNVIKKKQRKEVIDSDEEDEYDYFSRLESTRIEDKDTQPEDLKSKMNKKLGKAMKIISKQKDCKQQ